MNTIALQKHCQPQRHRVAGGLVLIGYEDEDKRLHSITASSFNSLSLCPRLVIWCVAHEQNGRPRMPEGAQCGLSVMAADQRDLWSHCVNDRGADHFEWFKGTELGAPLIKHAAANFEVTITRRINQGSYVLYIGEVGSFSYSEACDGLINYLDDLRVPLLHE
ncbi:flavin reductase family protein [Pusillimonas sp. SM2304]|uniref:flavin reductase family protein n=1 Tax=Pusillimonas sp. SM2304 TaxID=3073241 RepID=UPI002876C419|nr:flavin reductase family protein [Pusillimonas sp. SM2304]MDS1139004.1 flavin reductase family protein [Pusillimonas sp. SM2304]